MRSVDVLYIEGAPGLDETLAVVREAMAERGAALSLRMIKIESQEQALRERFLGSPSVRVRGRDVEAFRQNDLRFGFQCRLYPRPDGAWAHAPTKEMLLLALARYG